MVLIFTTPTATARTCVAVAGAVAEAGYEVVS
jgi:hypothetical protein